MGTVRNPAYGIYPKEDRHTSSVGSLIRQSKNKGDGWWCPWCYKKGKYGWVTPGGLTMKEGTCDTCNK